MRSLEGEYYYTTAELSEILGFIVTKEFMSDIGAPPDFVTPIGNYWAASELSGIAFCLSQYCHGLQLEADEYNKEIQRRYMPSVKPFAKYIGQLKRDKNNQHQR